MAVLSPQDETYLRELFAQQLVSDVTISLFTQKETRLLVPGLEQQSQWCQAANQIAEEVSGLSDKIHLQVYDYRADTEKLQEHAVDKIPALLVGTDSTRPARFFGVPSGYEFSTLVQDIIDLSRANIELSEESQKTLREVDEDVHIQVFVTPT